MTIIILSKIDDAHAVCVEAALLQKGAKVIFWSWADFPSNLKFNVEISQFNFNITGFSENIDNTTLWVHRDLNPVVSEMVHPADRNFVLNESLQLLNGMLFKIAENAFCVNPLPSRLYMNSKITQLSLAVKCGLSIPSTIYSNDPDEIIRFFKQHGEKIIVKYSSPMSWEAADGSISTPYTARISEMHLSNRSQLAACPSIFQEEIEKQYELRIVFFGATIFAIKIPSQDDENKVDWRMNFQNSPPCEVFTLPTTEEYRIRSFIAASGLLYGSIDMIVLKSNKYVFLEVNETGQFLWIEDLLPQLPLLDCFTDFLIERNKEFRYEPGCGVLQCRNFDHLITFDALEKRRSGHIGSLHQRIQPE